MRYTYPDQMIPEKDKLAIKDGDTYPEFIMNIYRYFRDYANSQVGLKEEMSRLQDIADGLFDNTLSDYNHVINPYNEPDPKKRKKYPAKLRNYDIINPIIDRFLGERRDLPDTSKVYNKSPNGTNAFKEAIQKAFKQKLATHLLLEMQQMGYDVSAGVDQVPDYTKLKDEVETNWGDAFAINGQNSLDYLKSALDTPNTFQMMYKDFLVCGFAFGLKEVHHNDVHYHRVSPLELDIYGWSSESRYAEDANAAVRRMKWSSSSVLDRFRANMTDDDIRLIQKWDNENEALFGPNSYRGVISTPNGTFVEYVDGNIIVEHIVWKTWKRGGVLTYIALTGNPERMPVDETYVFDPANGDIEISWTWENEVWEIYAASRDYTMMDAGEVIILEYGPTMVQQPLIENTSVCKLPYNGTYYGSKPGVIRSVVKSGESYQQLYNIFHFLFERSMAKNKDKLMLFPMGLIPKHKDWNESKWLYTIEAFSIAFFDDSADKALALLQGIKEIDMSLYQYMNKMWEFMQAIKSEWWEAIGFNPQRYGNIATTAGKGTTNQAIVRGAISSLEMFMMFERFREKEEEGMINYSKFAWIDGKKAQYVNSDRNHVFFEINGIEHASSEYGVFVLNNARDRESADFIKTNILQPLAQNGLGGDIIAEVADTDNMARIKELLRKGQKLQQEFQMQQQQQQLQGQQAIQQSIERVEAMKDQRERDLAQLKADTEIEKALIISDSFNAQYGDNDADGVDQSVEIVDRHNERMQKQAALSEQRRANMSKEAIAREGLQVKREDIAAKKEIASKNKNKYDN